MSHLRKLQDFVLIDNPVYSYHQEKEGGENEVNVNVVNDKRRSFILSHLPWLKYFDNQKVTQQEQQQQQKNLIAAKQQLERKKSCAQESKIMEDNGGSKQEYTTTSTTTKSSSHHPLESLVLDLCKEVSSGQKNLNSEPAHPYEASFTKQLLRTTNEYLTNAIQSNDKFTNELRYVKGEIDAQSNEVIEKMVHIKDELELLSKKEGPHDEKQKWEMGCKMMDMEMDLSKEVDSIVKKFRTEKLENGFIKSRQESKDLTIDEFTRISKELRNVPVDERKKDAESQKNEEDNNSNYDQIVRDYCDKIKEFEDKDQQTCNAQIKACIGDFQTKHSLRIREIYNILSTNLHDDLFCLEVK